jgi:hypothetical protein
MLTRSSVRPGPKMRCPAQQCWCRNCGASLPADAVQAVSNPVCSDLQLNSMSATPKRLRTSADTSVLSGTPAAASTRRQRLQRQFAAAAHRLAR